MFYGLWFIFFQLQSYLLNRSKNLLKRLFSVTKIRIIIRSEKWKTNLLTKLKLELLKIFGLGILSTQSKIMLNCVSNSETHEMEI